LEQKLAALLFGKPILAARRLCRSQLKAHPSLLLEPQECGVSTGFFAEGGQLKILQCRCFDCICAKSAIYNHIDPALTR
ncbi:MAG: hypothetical protein ACK41E_06800, partial [Deinococcales bacterium]